MLCLLCEHASYTNIVCLLGFFDFLKNIKCDASFTSGTSSLNVADTLDKIIWKKHILQTVFDMKKLFMLHFFRSPPTRSVSLGN